ncbi:accessory Sec system protein Asp1 [Lactococcus garvieae]|uniref:Accessory secretory protein Asp1 n=1 Tax=Lactococcus garvieae DCC43 TaxID=1231377 RepID=K2PWG6_9LACT|nr:accessory Sec system protein Asp1 [Lactococcus garvieae]EKF51781.1 Accessory secretory protein Asp1 [Lactococcus garvieae DCC43]
MIYFIPAWDKEQRNQLNTDDLTGQIKAFMDADDDYRVVIMDYNPELHYFLHQLDLLESNTVYIYDSLQLNQPIDQKALSFSDLSFPKEAYMVYTPFNILVYFEGKQIGKISLGRASQILEVVHYSKQSISEVETYDDRGFISSRKHYENGILLYTELLDISGNWIFREFYESGCCELNKENTKGLIKQTYTNKEELQFELLHHFLSDFKSDDALVMSVTAKNREEIKKNPYLENMTLSVFQNRWSWYQEEKEDFLEIFEKVNAVIVDTEVSFKELKTRVTEKEKNKIFNLTPYDTRFELSISQEMKEEVLYLEGRFLNDEELDQTIEILLDYMTTPLQEENNQRSFKVIIRTESNSEKEKVTEHIEQLLYERYAVEIEFLSQIKPSQKKENTIEEEKLEQQYPKLSLVRQLKEAWDVQYVTNEEALFKIIHQARLIIDLSDAPDLLTQIAGISAAIPQINTKESDYIHDKKNGKIIKNRAELSVALSYYLDTLHHWQKARAFSAQQIKKFSGGQLREKLCHIVGRKS